MKQIGSVQLQFDPQLNQIAEGKELRHGLSIAAQLGDSLWLANDETLSLERLVRLPGAPGGELAFGGHVQFGLADFLDVPVPPAADPAEIEEADIEGLDFDGGYLWLVGSHSLKRAKPRDGESARKGAKRLRTLSADGNRFLLARIPLQQEAGQHTLVKKVKQDGVARTAARLRGGDQGNDLTRALASDPHLQDFLAIPGKDNGFDIEGLVVLGERVLLGLRGPVLRGWATVLELALEEADDDPSLLKLKKIGVDKSLYLKHFLPLEGLGVRDLCRQGDDLLILAGPTMDLDGPVTVFRWAGAAREADGGLVERDVLTVVGSVPFGQGPDRGRDHAEGMALFSPDGDDPRALLIAYDSAADGRLGPMEGCVRADIFALPG